jgi:hypothetical protein
MIAMMPPAVDVAPAMTRIVMEVMAIVAMPVMTRIGIIEEAIIAPIAVVERTVIAVIVAVVIIRPANANAHSDPVATMIVSTASH